MYDVSLLVHFSKLKNWMSSKFLEHIHDVWLREKKKGEAHAHVLHLHDITSMCISELCAASHTHDTDTEYRLKCHSVKSSTRTMAHLVQWYEIHNAYPPPQFLLCLFDW